MSERGPDRIWLQCRDISDPENRDVELSEATWCVDEIDSTDEEYVRVDLFADLRAAVELITRQCEQNATVYGEVSETYLIRAEKAEAEVERVLPAVEAAKGWKAGFDGERLKPGTRYEAKLYSAVSELERQEQEGDG